MDASVELGSVIVLGALVVVAVFFRVVVMWLYNGSGRSVLVVALFHSAYNSAWGTGDKNFTNELLSGSALLYAVVAAAVVAVILAVLTRGRLAYEHGHAAPQRAEAAGVDVQPSVR
jgi:hypothetical protein